MTYFSRHSSRMRILRILTSSSAAAERPRDALCPSVVSFNSVIARAQSLLISWAPEANVDWYGEILPSFPPSPPLPSPSLPFPPLPLEVGPLNPARGSGGALQAPPVGSTNDLVHICAKRSSSGGNSFMDFHGNKFNFLVHDKFASVCSRRLNLVL